MNTGVQPALARNFRVIALDYRGHGKSDKPHDPKAYGMEMARDVLRLMDHRKIARAHLVGYSLGGHIVAKLLTTSPERFLTATLGASAAARGTPSPGSFERAAAEFEKAPFRSTVLLLVPTNESTPDEETIRAQARQFAAGNDLAAMVAVIRGMSDLYVTEGQLNEVRVPSLALDGTADKMLADVKVLKKGWPALKLVTIEGATHSNIIPPGRGAAARPEFVNAIRDFIAANKQ